MIGRAGLVRHPLEPIGTVAIDGELWRARRSSVDEEQPPARAGDPVIVEDIQGLMLTVRRAETWEVEP